MLATINEAVLARKDLFEAYSYLATIFALLVPLPIWVFSYTLAKRRERRERTLELLQKFDQNEKYTRPRNTYLGLIERLDDIARALEECSEDEINDLRVYMNQMETMSLMLSSSVYDIKMVSRLWRHTFVDDFRKLKPFVDVIRLKRNNPRLFVEWEALAHKLGRGI